MKHEKSCGIVTYILINNEIHYLLERQNNGFLSFPKGHVEGYESEKETALRECLEETGLKADIKDGFREVINYYIPEYDVNKDVVLFVGEIDNLDYHRQEKEITDIKIYKYEEALESLQFDNWKNVLKKADAFIRRELLAPKTVLAYIEKDDSYLMLFRNKKKKDINKGKWIGVGGHLEKDETPEEALIREIKEETGLDVNHYQYRGLIHFNYDDFKELMYLYVVDEVSGELSECDEGTLKYIKKSDLFNLELWEGDRIFLKKLLDNDPFFELELNYLEDKLISYKFVK